MQMRGVFPVMTLALVAGLSGVVGAQQAEGTKEAPNLQPPAAAKIDILLTRSNGNKTLSSLPYSINGAEGQQTHLRLGSQVPIPHAAGSSYQNVGSSIDCLFTALNDGRYRLSLTLDDSSLPEGFGNAIGVSGPPVLRSYRIQTLLVLRNGETTTFNVATDKVTGDTIRAQVTMTALK
jgi:hypothetical protein